MHKTVFVGVLFWMFTSVAMADDVLPAPQPAIAMHGQPKYAVNFGHFDYADPLAVKGGTLRLADLGSFNNLNPFIVKGEAAAGLGLLSDSLMAQSADEPFSLYGLVAESITVPADRSWAIFKLRPEAKFHDGSPITPDDVIFTLETLRTLGQPEYGLIFKDVAKAEKIGEREVKFTFAGKQNRELPLIVAQMAILSKAYYAKHKFEDTTLEPPLGSGPYEVESVDAGRSITYMRVKNYWAANLPVSVGRFNFDTIRYDYYRDPTVALEALKAGAYDLREENISKQWKTNYDSLAVKKGLLIQAEIPHKQPQGMQGYVFNTRKALFADRRVREALQYAFDFEWLNKNVFNGAYTRSESYFANSDLASHGLPTVDELAILAPYKAQLPPELFTQPFQIPKTDGTGDIRGNLRKAFALFKSAGWAVKDGAMRNQSGQAFSFEILSYDEASARIAQNFKQNLTRMGIEANVRVVDIPQYQKRLDSYDFDMIMHRYGQSMSPGNEQRAYWGSAGLNSSGGQNMAGVHDTVVDQLVERVISAKDWNDLVVSCRALDRVLLWGFYVVPHWHIKYHRVAYWDKFSRPTKSAPYGLGYIDTWWQDAAKAAGLEQKRKQLTSP